MVPAERVMTETLMRDGPLERMLERTHGNQAEAARLSDLDRTYLGRLVSRLGMNEG